MKTQVTIYDIARHLNISKSTVSRALTGHPHINSETRRSVLELAEQMDYQRNPLSINLLSNRTYNIGILLPEFTTSFFPQVVAGAQQIAAKAGYNVILSLSNDNYETEVENSRMLLTSKVDGLLVSISNQTHSYDHLKIFSRRSVPVVLLNSFCDEMLVPRVIVNDYDASFLAVEHLIKSGKRRIAYLGGLTSIPIHRKRLNGYKDALGMYNIPRLEELMVSFDLNINHVKEYVKMLIAKEVQIDAIFAASDTIAVEAMKTVKRAGLRIPEDIAIVGFGNNYGSDSTDPGLTTLSPPEREMGRAAMSILIGMMNKDSTQWRAITKSLEAELIVRGSA